MVKSSRGNPYHDEMGRFCSAAKATRACVCGQYYDISEYNEEEKKKFVRQLAENKEEFYKNQTEKRKEGIKRTRNTDKPKKAPGINKGTPKEQLQKAKESLSRHMAVGDLGKTDKELMAENMELLAGLSEEYPLLSGTKVRFSTNADMKKHVEKTYFEMTGFMGRLRGALGSAVAKAWDGALLENTGETGYAISFRENAFKKKEEMCVEEKRQIEMGFHVDTGDVATASLRHEYGHVVVLDICKRTGKSQLQIYKEVTSKLDKPEVIGLMSDYGNSKKHEWLAEAFANGTGSRPNRAGLAMVEYLNEYYKGQEKK